MPRPYWWLIVPSVLGMLGGCYSSAAGKVVDEGTPSDASSDAPNPTDSVSEATSVEGTSPETTSAEDSGFTASDIATWSQTSSDTETGTTPQDDTTPPLECAFTLEQEESPRRPDYSQVWGVDPNDFWFGGRDALVHRVAGHTQDYIDPENDITISGIQGFSKDDVYFYGKWDSPSDGRQDFLARWDGADLSVPLISEEFQISRMWGSSSTDIYLVVRPFQAKYDAIWRFNGESWLEVPPIPGVKSANVFGCSQEEVYALDLKKKPFVYRLDDDEWLVVEGGVPTSFPYYGVCVAPGHIVVARDALLYHYKDGAWEIPQFLGPGYSLLSGLSVDVDRELWANLHADSFALHLNGAQGLEVLDLHTTNTHDIVGFGGGDAIAVGNDRQIITIEDGAVRAMEGGERTRVAQVVALEDAVCAAVDGVSGVSMGPSGALESLPPGEVGRTTAAASFGGREVLVASHRWEKSFAPGLFARFQQLHPWETIASLPSLQVVSSKGPRTLDTGAIRMRDLCAHGGSAYYSTTEGQLWASTGGPPQLLAPAPSSFAPHLACDEQGLVAVGEIGRGFGSVRYVAERLEGQAWRELGSFEVQGDLRDIVIVGDTVYGASTRGEVLRLHASGSEVVAQATALADCSGGSALASPAPDILYAMLCGELYRFDVGDWSKEALSLPEECMPSAMAADPSTGALLLGCLDSFALYDGIGWSEPVMLPVASGAATAIAPFDDGQVLVGTYDGEVLLVGPEMTEVVATSISGPVLWLEGDDESLWIGWQKGSVSFLADGAEEKVRHAPHCDIIVSMIGVEEDRALALCRNGDLLSVTKDKVESLALTLPWPIVQAGDVKDFVLLSGTGPDDLYVAKRDSFNDRLAPPLCAIFRFDGKQWSELSAMPGQPEAILRRADGGIMAVASVPWDDCFTYGDSATAVLAWNEGSASWETIRLLGPESCHPKTDGATFTRGGEVFVATEDGALHRFDGSQWTSASSPFDDPYLLSVNDAGHLCLASSSGEVWSAACAP